MNSENSQESDLQATEARQHIGAGSNPSAQVTLMLERARHGDQSVVDELMPLIYEELRTLAKHHLSHERPGHTLQPTALVHEAYVRLVGSDSGPWQDRAHFFAVAATTIRRILVQHARAKHSVKRGGKRKRFDIADFEPVAQGQEAQLLSVDAALERLAAFDAQKAKLVELRYFAGLSMDEAAVALKISPRTAARYWNLAKAWLVRELREEALSAS